MGVRCLLLGIAEVVMQPGRFNAMARPLAHPDQELPMSDHVYKLVDIVGSSAAGTDDAIRNAIETAAKTLRRIDWFEVVETRGHVADGKVAHFQVTLRVGFRLE
jgi:flavin-binding protein dodecin